MESKLCGGLYFAGEVIDVDAYTGGYNLQIAFSTGALARRMAAKVQKYKKSVMLEPMNPYERRIIHSEIQNIEGVSTNSIGSESNRKLVIFHETSNEA